MKGEIEGRTRHGQGLTTMQGRNKPEDKQEEIRGGDKYEGRTSQPGDVTEGTYPKEG
ncbi:UNVERIFIED_CONTAM: hypothetical protein Sradi_6982400 [Sesamum radiatum]|uniref:Uncharacterized protein n=1 Tax=Sesamum radiatum TaxID=300843 RepID=A0AAW2JGH2_SESRA